MTYCGRLFGSVARWSRPGADRDRRQCHTVTQRICYSSTWDDASDTAPAESMKRESNNDLVFTSVLLREGEPRLMKLNASLAPTMHCAAHKSACIKVWCNSEGHGLSQRGFGIAKLLYLPEQP